MATVVFFTLVVSCIFGALFFEGKNAATWVALTAFVSLVAFALILPEPYSAWWGGLSNYSWSVVVLAVFIAIALAILLAITEYDLDIDSLEARLDDWLEDVEAPETPPEVNVVIPTEVPSATPIVVATAVPTAEPIVPTSAPTLTPMPTATAIPPTATPIPPTAVPTRTPTATPTHECKPVFVNGTPTYPEDYPGIACVNGQWVVVTGE